MTATPRTVLFLCSGNYYRSRFAEILFNHRAREENLGWRALSCGLTVDRPNNNVGPVSRHTLAGLEALAIDASASQRSPIQVTEDDLRDADLIVAVKEAEHRPLLQERFPGWDERVEYWAIHDLDCATAQETLSALAERVERLVARLSAHPSR